MPGQLALTWLLHQVEDIISIPGTNRSKYLEENPAAVDVTLTEAVLRCIDEVAPKGVAAGKRYNEAFMRTVNR
jgi:aryl-alcohol dehydrogenase-like predicted oxidoreductase